MTIFRSFLLAAGLVAFAAMTGALPPVQSQEPAASVFMLAAGDAQTAWVVDRRSGVVSRCSVHPGGGACDRVGQAAAR